MTDHEAQAIQIAKQFFNDNPLRNLYAFALDKTLIVASRARVSDAVAFPISVMPTNGRATTAARRIKSDDDVRRLLDRVSQNAEMLPFVKSLRIHMTIATDIALATDEAEHQFREGDKAYCSVLDGPSFCVARGGVDAPEAFNALGHFWTFVLDAVPRYVRASLAGSVKTLALQEDGSLQIWWHCTIARIVWGDVVGMIWRLQTEQSVDHELPLGVKAA